jgi:hypothetical protein
MPRRPSDSMTTICPSGPSGPSGKSQAAQKAQAATLAQAAKPLSARVGLAHRIRNARSRDQSSTLTSVHTDGKHSDSGHGSRWNRRDSAELRGAFAYALPYRRGLGAISKRRENGVRLA